MSHAYGAVKFNDGTILHYEYNGTVDFVIPNLRDSMEEVSANWRNGRLHVEHDKNCREDEEVIIFSTYGNGFSWKGRACKKCKLITAGFEPDYDTEVEGYPDWYPKEK